VLFEQNVIDSLEGKILTSKTELQNQMIWMNLEKDLDLGLY
jgi:hypothetical protein